MNYRLKDWGFLDKDTGAVQYQSFMMKKGCSPCAKVHVACKLPENIELNVKGIR